MSVNWDSVVISEIATVENGFAFSADDYVSSGIVNFRVANIQADGSININDDIKYLPFSFAETHKDYLLNEGDILLVMVGATRGKLCQIDKSVLPALMNQNMWRIRSNSPRISQDFLYFLLRAQINDFASIYSDEARGFFNKSHFREYKIALPPLPEQHAITEILRAAQYNVIKAEFENAHAEKTKRSILRSCMENGTFHSSETIRRTLDTGMYPSHWSPHLIKDACEVEYGVQAAVAHLLDSAKGTPILTNINITSDGRLDLETLRYYEVPSDKRSRVILKKGDVLFNWRSGSASHVGKTAYFDLDGEYTHSSFILRLRCNSNLRPKFLAYYLHWVRISGYFVNMRNQSSINSVFNKSITELLPIPIPPLDEQDAITEQLSASDRLVDTTSTKLIAARNLFASLLYHFISGKVRTKEFSNMDYGSPL